MNREAIFSDCTKQFIWPAEVTSNSKVKIKLRVDRLDEPTIKLVANEMGIAKEMRVSYVGERFTYYEASMHISNKMLTYHFELDGDGEYVYYDAFGVSDYYRPEYEFRLIPDFDMPDWAQGAVMYQIMVDRFAQGDQGNDVENNEYYYIKTMATHVEDWNKPPADFGVAEFYGGDLQGVMDNLRYIKGLGVEAIYFNPIFVSPSSHKYDIADYDHIDPHLAKVVEHAGEDLNSGDTDNTHASKYINKVTNWANLNASDEFFAKFVEEAHHMGIKVILDGVFNHCGSFNKWLDREGIYKDREGFEPGAYQQKDSPYHDFFRFNDESEGAWPHNNSYDGWWGHDTLPKLNYEGSSDLYNYILEIGKKWVSPPYNCDGWRLDVAADLGHSEDFNHQFWKDFRRAVKSANPNAIILAEHYGDASSWLQGDQWDTVMNYDAFMEPVSYFFTGMEKHSDKCDPSAEGDGARFEMTMRHFMTKLPAQSLYTAMNELSNHDHSRFLTRTNHKVGRASDLGTAAASEGINIAVFKLAILMQVSWPGAPTIYYGDEAGVCGFTDPDNRRTYPWDTRDFTLIDYYRDAIMAHKISSAMRRGSFTFLKSGMGFVSYGRFNEIESVVIAINTFAHEIEIDVPVYIAEVRDGYMLQAFMTNEKGHSIMTIKTPVENGQMHVKLGPYTGIAFRQDK
ncbi:MAG: glycoside hydrolase family 13 protein [Lachnospiraceae bacterium]|nr:glycoside hydrolase family 13 protein [Lachnospiraceae bacterium]